MSSHWDFTHLGKMKTSLKYWGKQLTFLSPDETLNRVMKCLEQKKPGAYLKFGRVDIDAALGINKSGEELSDSFIQEIRNTFLFSWKDVLKALDVESPALKIPFFSHSGGISSREALDRLNSVGACFLDGPIFSYNALHRANLVQPDLLETFFEALRICRPILVFKEGEAREIVFEKLAPRISIPVSVGEIKNGIEQIEEKLLRISASAANSFPVIVLALDVTGRLLVRRLMKRGFSGFLVDLDNLNDPSFETSPVSRRFKFPTMKLAISGKMVVGKSPSVSGSSGKLPVRWEGPLLGHYSYSIINRELCFRLGSNNSIELTIRPSDTPFTGDPLIPANFTSFRSIVDNVGRPINQPIEFHISNHAQHPYLPPQEGRWVVILPWDYVSLPVRWLEWIRNQIDEVWVPSNFVRDSFLGAGISPDRVVVVPNGVDVRVYRPNARKVPLNTRKSFKFLFVGGPFWRKGFDVLLAAYGKAFSAHDGVSLVIKSAPEFWTLNGTKQLVDFRSHTGMPEVCTIVRSLDQAQMAGLYSACNCLVHPYRAEGFAICVAEGMASGLPVIVTAMGGTSDFCNSSTAFLVPAKLRQMNIKKLDNEPTLDFPLYAEPELDGLVEWMRYVYEHAEESRTKAREGMYKIRAEFTWDHAAEIIVDRLGKLENRPVQRYTKS